MIKKLITFSALYVSEGIEAAIATVVLPLYLAKLGYDAATVGVILSIVAIPWVIKFFWGLITDRFANKGRRLFILLGGILGAAMNLIIFFFHPSALPLLVALIFIARCGVATLDVSTDALAISISKKNERGKINGAEFFGQVIGYSFGAMYFSKLTTTNFALPFLAAAIIIISMISTVFLISDAKAKPSLKKLKHMIKKDILKFMLMIVIINIPFGMLGIAAFYMKAYLNYSASQVGLLMTLSGIITAIGSLIGGYLSDKFGRIKISQIAVVGYGLSILPAIKFFAPAYLISSIFSGMITSALCALCMDKTKKEVAGTEYSIFTSTANLGSTIGTTVSGFLLHAMNFEFFILVGASAMFSLIALKFISSH